MIPASTRGNMPFLSPIRNNGSQERNNYAINTKLSNTSHIAAQLVFSNPQRSCPKSTTTCRGPKICLNTSPHCRTNSKEEPPTQTSTTSRQEVIHGEHSLKSFMKVLFRSKHRRQSKQNSLKDATLTQSSPAIPRPHEETKHAVMMRTVDSSCKFLNRSHSVHASDRNKVNLEAIVEEESSLPFVEEQKLVATSRPTSLENLSTLSQSDSDSDCSSCVETTLEELIQNGLILPPDSPTGEDHCSCNSNENLSHENDL